MFVCFLFFFSNTIWPGGVRPHHGNQEGEEEEEEEEGAGERVKMLRSVLVRAKLIGTVPDDLRRLLGTRRTTQGMVRWVWLSWLCFLYSCSLESPSVLTFLTGHTANF